MVNWKCKVVICVLSVLGLASFANGQIPGLGGCPDFSPIHRFDRMAFLGTWYEVERYFTVSEVATKCVAATYELLPDGNIYVRNALTNRFSNVERIISGVMEAPGRSKDGKYIVRYQSFPYNYNATFMVLDTDYTSFAVIYSCSPIGPIGHTVSAWILTRERFPPGPVVQRAYGILDKYAINRTFFLKTAQEDCVVRAPPIPAIDPTVPTVDGTVINTEEELDQLRNDIFAMPRKPTQHDPVGEEDD
ncbi:apolipoprotein D-like [Toxorhynchites rutilus septentrionalis]|uniref:apolipoprotein D-like n=1 Tax=Toxorhynchites rutilus septentrionalis TaxID=329112 RepID=UPI0024785E98|nr:apolipoprotein D-like [Toxorhynchites rutilus septentrionalis]